MLTPIIVTGLGRSGSTAIMALLASDPRVVMDREYPFENCQLTYFAKLALMQDRPASVTEAMGPLIDFDESTVGPYPRQRLLPATLASTDLLPSLRSGAWIRSLWQGFDDAVHGLRPDARYYAEKAPPWLAPNIRDVIPCSTIYLFRDPRDVFLSSNAFMKKKGFLSFGRNPGDSDWDFAHTVAHDYLSLYENYRADRERADCLKIEYRQYVQDLLGTIRRVQEWTDLHLFFEPGANYLPAHITSTSVEQSVYRWQQEEISPRILEFFDRHLQEPIRTLGYVGPGIEAPLTGKQFDGTWLAGNGNSLETSPDGRLEPDDDHGCRIILTGPDFFVLLPFEPFLADDYPEIWVCLRRVAGTCNSIYWRGPNEDYSEERCVHLPFHGAAHWQVVRFRLRQHPRWKGTIAQVRVDAFNGPINPTENIGWLRWVRLVD